MVTFASLFIGKAIVVVRYIRQNQFSQEASHARTSAEGSKSSTH